MTVHANAVSVPGEFHAKIERVVFHWTVGGPKQGFPVYHDCIEDDGSVLHTLPLYCKGSNVWKRNTGLIGIAACGSNFNAKQKQTGAVLAAEIIYKYGLKIAGSVTMPKYKRVGVPDTKSDDLVLAGGTVIIPVLSHHEAYAKIDGYPSERVDIGWALMAEMFSLSVLHYNKLKTGKATLQFHK